MKNYVYRLESIRDYSHTGILTDMLFSSKSKAVNHVYLSGKSRNIDYTIKNSKNHTSAIYNGDILVGFISQRIVH